MLLGMTNDNKPALAAAAATTTDVWSIAKRVRYVMSCFTGD